MSFKCRRCDYVANDRNHLIRHLSRKYPCKIIKEDISCDDCLKDVKAQLVPSFVCEFCSKSYSHRCNLSRHKKSCKHKVEQESEIRTVAHTLQLLREEIRQLKISTASTDRVQIQNNTGENINIQNITIHMRSFGCENTSHIEHNPDFLTSCLMQRDIKSVIESIHCDKEHPENHNVRIKSLRNDLMETFVDGKWIITDKEETLDELVRKGYRILRLHTHHNKNIIKDEYDDGEIEDTMQWLEDIYEDNKLRKPIKRQLLLLFLNNKALLLGRDEEQ